jgi:glycosyltransferase involved in cell wall biosynthesis
MSRRVMPRVAARPVPAVPRPEPWEPRLRYHAWILQQMPTPDDLTRQRLAVRRWTNPPTISVVTPVWNTPPEMLRRMVRSVRRQSYPHWELCLVDDGSPAPWMSAALARLAAGDPRIRVARRACNGGIVAASNDALALATGEFIALLDDDDELDPRALFALAREIVARRDVDLLYTDFDVIGTDGVRHEPILAPAWSPELLLTLPYIVHLTAYRRDLVQRVGGFRPEYEGSQDYDLALRVTRATDRIVHIPEVLYHWRAWARSAAGNPAAKPYAYAAGVRAITEHLRDHAFEARREDGHALGFHGIRFAIKNRPLVSVIVPLLPRHGDTGDNAPHARDAGTLRRRLATLLQGTAYEHVECLIVGPGAAAAAADAIRADARTDTGAETHGSAAADADAVAVADADALDGRVRFVAYDGPADAALAANAGAAHARGEHLLFLDGDLEPLRDDWLGALLEFSQQPAIGVVGAKIYRSDGVIWHAGIIVPRAAPHLVWRDDLITRNYAAVSGACLMTPRATFEAAGGFRSRAEAGCSDVDYCLRVIERGERIVLTPHARLRHTGAPPAEAGPAHRAIFQQQWAGRMELDPYYNRNYRQDGAWFAVALD